MRFHDKVELLREALNLIQARRDLYISQLQSLTAQMKTWRKERRGERGGGVLPAVSEYFGLASTHAHIFLLPFSPPLSSRYLATS